MAESIFKKAGKFVKDSALLLRPLGKKEKWDIKRLYDYVPEEDIKKVKKSLKQGKAKIDLEKLEFSFLISGKNVLPQIVSEEVDFEEINEEIEAKFYEKLFKEFSSRAYEVLFHYLASEVMNLAEMKRAVALQLFAKHPLHILIIGESGSGASNILKSVNKLSPTSSYGVGSGVSQAGLTLSSKGKKVNLGLLPRSDKGVCCLSELQSLNKKEKEALSSVMSKGFVKHDKGDKSIKKKARANVLASAEPKKGSFNKYSPSQIKKRTPFDSSFLSQFNLIFIAKKPNSEEFKVVADKIIKESVEKEISEDEIDFIKRYIEYTRDLKVEIPKHLSDQVEEFVVGLKDMEEKLPYDITSKTVEGVLSLIKSSARSELREKVTSGDLDRVFSIVRKAFQV